ncbi:MAG: hypothetical protein Kow0029_27180 [Candidatus Rifleibacteriota bacterium]
MKKLVIFFLFMFMSFLSSVSGDVLYLNEGEEIIGKLVSIGSETVSFEDLKAGVKQFKQNEVAHILISKIRKGDEISKISQITDPATRKILSNLPSPAEFPDSDYITLLRRNEFKYTENGEVILTCRNVVFILKEPGLDQANNSIYYYSDRENCDLLYAHTYSPDGKVFHITDDAISNESLRSATPEYARLKKLKMALKKVDIGSIIDYCYVRKLKDVNELKPYVISYVFGEREPVLLEEFIVNFPETLELAKTHLQWTDDCPVKFTQQNENDHRLWKWSFSDKKGFIPEQNMLPGTRIFPRVVVYQSYSWEKTAKMLAEAYKKAEPKSESLDELIRKAGISEGMSAYAKVSSIYETINKEFRDVGMSISQMGSFEPVSTQVTLEKKYGNTQNLLALMHFALRKLGIKSYPGFCSDKRENVTVKDYSSLGFADYAILKVMIDGHEFFTDGGSIYRPFGTLSTGLQGAKACFLDTEDMKFSFGELPKTTFEWNRFDRTALVKIKKDGAMEVKETLQFRGPYESGIRELKSIKDQEKRNYAEKRVKRVHPNAVLKGFGFSDMKSLDSPAVLTLSYVIPNAAQKASDEIMTFTNFWINYQSSSASLLKRKYPMQYWSTEENNQTIIFELPDGFNWVPWNRQYKFASGNISFSSNMNQHGNLLIYADRFVARDDEFISDEAYQNYRNCILTMSELANQWIIIEREKENVAETSEAIGKASDTVELKQTAAADTASATSTQTITETSLQEEK